MAGELEPIEGVLAVLDSGSASGTNKFGLLLALIDLAPMVPADGFVGDVELATKLIEIHWDHGRPYGAHVLRQTTARNKDNIVIVAEVESLRAHLLTSNKPTAPFEHVLPMIDIALWNGSVKRVIAATRANPLKRLQVLDRQRTTFLYEIEGGGLRFLPQAQQALVRFGPVLRDLVEFRYDTRERRTVSREPARTERTVTAQAARPGSSSGAFRGTRSARSDWVRANARTERDRHAGPGRSASSVQRALAEPTGCR